MPLPGYKDYIIPLLPLLDCLCFQLRKRGVPRLSLIIVDSQFNGRDGVRNSEK